MNSLSFCVSENVLISPSFLTDSLPGIEFLVGCFCFLFFFFQDFEYTIHSFQACKICVEKFTNHLMEIPFCVMSHFLLLLSKFSSCLWHLKF